MGRKTLAQKYYEELEAREKESNQYPATGKWIVLYDFCEFKPQRGFWLNIHRLKPITGVGKLVQYSSYVTSDWKGVLSVVMLVKHYDGTAKCYKIEDELVLPT